MQEVKVKLEADLPSIVSEDSLMAHLVDELLLFDHELSIMFPGTTHHIHVASDPAVSSPVDSIAEEVGGAGCKESAVGHVSRLNILDVLLNEAPFDKWRNLEKSCRSCDLKEECHVT